ncbi:Glutamate synthase [NADPH] small chain [Anoxybacillus ayderensis]|uniref:Glutamate synthase [NADPH] small chain n=1 Tax=Anoxybacillus ayderensis TaxID=265546 RepID=A0A0D0HQR2_9BACL|nr:glutamate synthase subunit beta [Anoxybacillus ayderensis]EPZ38060.1 glutamate synthase subunit beta [Anoxybacillus ayderensis]KIP20213.1 Glutamate synthase [NADPH] small chain [Anoxybacillus ayderensis]
MGKATGFMEYVREEEKKRDPLSRLHDWNEYTFPFSNETLARQGARCMDCGTPFCHVGMELNGLTSGCPIHNLIPEWNDLVYRGRWKEAFERLAKTNNFPEFTGRVCPAPCEGSCTVAISDPAVAIKGIERAIIDKAFAEGWVQPRIPNKRTGKKVAVIGSGPAGLACADELNQAGHFVTVYERADRIGGLLTYGIPNMKLGKDVVERRVRLLSEEGITFITNTEVGKHITVDELQKQYDAVVLCVGAQKQRDLVIEGRELDGVHFAMDYLTRTTKWLLTGEKEETFIDAKNKHVIVIGGGDTGADCVATALRQQCKSVVQFGKHPALPTDRASDNPWPQYPLIFTVDYAYEEAEAKFGTDPRQYCIQTKKIVGDDRGNVKELHTIQMEKIVDEHGRIVFKEIPGTEKVWPCDIVLIAIGFEGPEPSLLQQFGVETGNKKGKASRYKTNVKGVFVAGDARRGQSLVVWAIHEGREAAKEISRFLCDK